VLKSFRPYQHTCTEVRKAIDLEVAVWASVGTVFGDDKPICAQSLPSLAAEYVAFHQDLIVASAMNGLVQKILVQVVVDVLVTKSSSRTTRATSSSSAFVSYAPFTHF
jgi:hypothetical protein